MNTKPTKHILSDTKVKKTLQWAAFGQYVKAVQARGGKFEERDGTWVLVEKDGRTHLLFPKPQKKEKGFSSAVEHALNRGPGPAHR